MKMDKRKFLKSTLTGAGALGLAAPVAAQSRLFGTPGSVIPILPAVADQIHLALSKVSMPTPAWELLTSATAAVQELVGSATARADFARAPTQFFADRGLPPGTFEPNSPDLAMAR